jgi:DNA-directed RNA polymerase specialized sigma24 family protein
MSTYVNRQAMREIFAPLEAQDDPRMRVDQIEKIEAEFCISILEQYERTAYELKTQGLSTGQIADLFDVSERKVKNFIRWYSERTGRRNPLERYSTENVIDISHIVTRAKKNRPA